MNRTILLHYHLFKNAGTSLDRILKANFGSRWRTAEFAMDRPDNSAELADWIRATPDGIAYSTHTALGPVPQIEGVRIVSVMLLRDPLARIHSAYRFERRQDARTWGAQLAKETDFEGYVRARLARDGDRQCRNFQTHRLASLVPGPAPELERALQGLGRVTVIGRVEAFDAAMARLARALAADYPGFTWQSVHANVSGDRQEVRMPPEVERLLKEANAQDIALLEHFEQSRAAV